MKKENMVAEVKWTTIVDDDDLVAVLHSFEWSTDGSCEKMIFALRDRDVPHAIGLIECVVEETSAGVVWSILRRNGANSRIPLVTGTLWATIGRPPLSSGKGAASASAMLIMKRFLGNVAGTMEAGEATIFEEEKIQ